MRGAAPPPWPGRAAARPTAEAPDWEGYLRFRAGFEAAMDPARHTIAWLDRQILSGAFGLIVGENAAVIVGIEHYPTGAREVHGQVAAGDLGEIVGSLIPRAERQARLIGCTGATISSRPGWAKLLGDSGYALHQVTVRKAL